MATTTTPITAEQLFAMKELGWRFELIAGEARRISPAGRGHGKIAMRFGWRLAQYVEQHDLGEAYAAETGFILSRDPDTVRAPDVSFVVKSRVAPEDENGFIFGHPDFAVEVISPNDRYDEVEEKVFQWLDAGTKAVLIINPRLKNITLYRNRTEIRVLAGDETFELPDLVPGWAVRVAEIFNVG